MLDTNCLRLLKRLCRAHSTVISLLIFGLNQQLIQYVSPYILEPPSSRGKTALGPMLALALLAYVISLIVFVLLVIDTSQTFTTETVIKSYDASGLRFVSPSFEPFI